MEAQELIDKLQTDILPEEFTALVSERAAARDQRMITISRAICDKRKEAIDGRRASGIEEEWSACEDQYAGIDNANRTDSRELKSASLEGPITSQQPAKPVKSTVYLNITRPYTDAAAARISDMLQQADEPAWAFEPTPVPELEAFKGDMRPLGNGMKLQEQTPEGQPAMDPNGQPMTRDATYDDAVRAKLKVANNKAERAQKRVSDWLTQCSFGGTFRDLMLDTAMYGSGVLKGPVPVWRKAKKATKNKNGSMTLDLVSSIDPESKRVSCWNLYPDPSCGNDIHRGGYIFEVEDLNGRGLRELKGLPGYSSARIDKVLAEGPGKKFTEGIAERPNMDWEGWCDTEIFQVWYFYGELEEREFEDLAADEGDIDSLFKVADLEQMQQGETSKKGSRRVFAVVTMVNDTPIKAAINPLDSGEFPYDVLPWQDREGMPWGYGVPYQIRAPQRMVVAATRNMMDNAGLAGGPILLVDQTMIEPVDGDWTICPRKVYRMIEGAIGKDVRTALLSVNIPMMQVELMGIIQFGLKMAEDVTGLPMILQGQLGKAPDTVGGMQMLQNNASSVTRRLALLVDSRITEPHMDRYYEWLMLYGPDEDEKGDYLIKARGSSTLVQRDAQNQLIQGLVQMSLNPAFNLSPERTMTEFLRSQHLDPSRFQLTDEEKQKLAQQPPPLPPQVQVAQIREQGAMERTKIEASVDAMGIKAELDRDAVYVKAETDRTVKEHEARMAELQVKRELEMLRYANTNKVTLEQIKAELAQTAAKLNLQRELALMPPAGAPEVSKPPTEPKGRAPKGQAYQH